MQGGWGTGIEVSTSRFDAPEELGGAIVLVKGHDNVINFKASGEALDSARQIMGRIVKVKSTIKKWTII